MLEVDEVEKLIERGQIEIAPARLHAGPDAEQKLHHSG